MALQQALEPGVTLSSMESALYPPQNTEALFAAHQATPHFGEILPGAAGFPRVILHHPSGARAEIHLWGATLTHWSRASSPLNEFWMDAGNRFGADGPIRGGIPLVYPWFGPHPTLPHYPRHGYARITAATIVPDPATSPPRQLPIPEPTPDQHCLVLTWTFPEGGHPGYPTNLPATQLALEIRLAAEELTLIYAVRNEGHRPLSCEMLLHPYFLLGSPLTARVLGLEQCSFTDKNAGGARGTIPAEGQGFSPAPDRIVDFSHTSPLTLHRPPLAPLVLHPQGQTAMVLWNSGPRPGGGPETAPPFACVEPGKVHLNPIRDLSPGHVDGIAISLRVEPPCS